MAGIFHSFVDATMNQLVEKIISRLADLESNSCNPSCFLLFAYISYLHLVSVYLFSCPILISILHPTVTADRCCTKVLHGAKTFCCGGAS